MVNLIKKANDRWKVTGEGKVFDEITSIETAAHFMAHYFKINDDEIDEALVEMYGFNRSRAIFGADGFLIETVES